MKFNADQFALFTQMKSYFISAIEETLKELLETKHLYQNANVAFPQEKDIKEKMGDSLPRKSSDKIIKHFDFVYSAFPEMAWSLETYIRKLSHRTEDEISSDLVLIPPDVKLYCKTCKNTEAYNLEETQDLLKGLSNERYFSEAKNKQIFSLTYQCQSCKGLPEIFMIRREGLKLMLCGRTPMEIVPTPAYLPKPQVKYFSGAVIAFNSGQVLAGKFLLRTFIEQYVRSESEDPTSEKVDTLLSAYNENLPLDFKKRFPSLKTVYAQLSTDLHGAVESEAEFLQAKSDIELHFEAKSLFDRGRNYDIRA